MVEHSIGAVVAVSLGVMLLALQTPVAQAQTEPPPGPPFQIVDACSVRVVEMPAQSKPANLTWAEFGAPFDEAFGVTAYAHGGRGDPRRENAQGLYQCTELVHRYLRTVHNIPTRIGLGLGHGVDLAAGLAERFGGQAFTGGVTGQTPVTLRYTANGAGACPPRVGSVVSVAMPPSDGTRGYGHVAVIRAIDADGPDVLFATLLEQHGGDYLAPGDVIDPGRIRFFRGAEGAWRGVYLSAGGRTFNVEGWTDIVALPEPPDTAAGTVTTR
jgi:hypothetical protein